MPDILASLRPVVRNARHVSINDDAVRAFADSFLERDLAQNQLGENAFLQDATREQKIAFPIVFGAMMYSFWGEPKWTIERDGKRFDGSVAVLESFKSALRDGYPLLDPAHLANLPEKDLRTMWAGNVEIPLFKERLGMLRDLGRTVQAQFGGSFSAIPEKGNHEAARIVDVLTTALPSVFNDTANYHGHVVQFHKRAQLSVAYLFELREQGLLDVPLSGREQLTAYADYKVPQGLRKLGILEYDDALACKVDAKTEIPAGSDEEIEIRALCVWAVERVVRELKKRFAHACAGHVDTLLWVRGQQKSPDDKPYHRTRTVQY